MPLLAIVVWALFAAPNSVFDVLVAEVAVKVFVLGGGGACRVSVLAGDVGDWTVLVVANTILLYVGPFAR